MTDTNHINNTFETSGISPPAQAVGQQKHAPQEQAPLTAEERKQRRTLGLKLFDVMLYPILNNFIVFGTSVAATYFTSRGNVHGGKIGKMLYDRGVATEKFYRDTFGMKAESAEMAKIVTWSFADGALLSPLVKLFEDRREKIGKWIDDKLGTTPANLDVYESEPKQTWGSVIKGRVAAGAVVLPTAILFDKTGVNSKLFDKRGQQLGAWIESHPRLASKFGPADIKEVARISIFEAVYTTICTGALYIFSRKFARSHDTKTGRVEIDPVSRQTIVRHNDHEGHAQPRGNDREPQKKDELATPTAQVSAVQAQARVAAQAPEQAHSA